MKILLTQSKDSAQSLADKLKRLGNTPIVFPTLEIHPTEKTSELMAAIQQLNKAHIVIFASKSAVHATIPLIQQYWTDLPEFVQCIAIGPGTQQALSNFGIHRVSIPPKPPFDSEQVLLLPLLKQVNNLKIFLFRGNGGRDLLPHTLIERGACVNIVECYQRTISTLSKEFLEKSWQEAKMDAIITTSSEGLIYFWQLFSDLPELAKVPFIVISDRMRQKAQALGCQHIFVAKSILEEDILKTLNHVKMDKTYV